MFSVKGLTNRVAGLATESHWRDRGSMIIEYAFLFAAVVLVAMVAASFMGASVLDLWMNNTERFATAVQPVVER